MHNTEKFTSPGARWITPVFFLLAFYCFGAGMMGSFVVYHTWQFVGEAEFSVLHGEASKRIVPFLVLPLLVMTVFLVLQFWHRPKAVSRKLVWIALICTIIPLLSSAFIQIPMQTALSNGKDEALLRQLIATDWLRVIPSIVLMITTLIMLIKSITDPLGS